MSTLTETEFCSALIDGNLEKVKEGIEEGINVNALAFGTDDVRGETMLYIPCKQGYADIAELLIKNNAYVHVVNNFGETLLHTASYYGHANIAELLIKNKVNIHAIDRIEGKTALYYACKKGHKDTAKLLIENGAGVNAVDFLNNTPLHGASKNGFTEIVKLLLEYGADSNAVNHLNNTPLHEACKKGHTGTAKLLIDSTFFKNPEERKPEFLEQYEQYKDLSGYWDNQVKKINISGELLGSEALKNDILTKISSGKNDTLLSLSFNKFFKSLNLEAIKNTASKTDQVDITPHKLG